MAQDHRSPGIDKVKIFVSVHIVHISAVGVVDETGAAYSVSGEYAMVKAGASLGYIEEERIISEMAVGVYRAGADIYLTYFAPEIARLMDEGRIG